jgi:hypothetical protein
VDTTTPAAPGTAVTPAARRSLHWAPLYRTAAAAATISALFIPLQIVVFVLWPPPLDGTAADWFAVFDDSRLLGFLNLDLLLVADNVLLIPILLALYIALRRSQEPVMTLAAALGFTSIAMYIATNPAVAMAALSDRYADAASDAERTSALAAAESALATWQGTAFHTAYLVGSLAGIAIGVVMLRSATFGKPTAYLGILGNAVGLGLYLPAVGVYISVFSVVFLEAWYVLVAHAMMRLGRGIGV